MKKTNIDLEKMLINMRRQTIINKINRNSWLIWFFVLLIIIIAAIFNFTGILFILSGLFGFFLGISVGAGGVYLSNSSSSMVHKNFFTTILGYITSGAGIYLVTSYFRGETSLFNYLYGATPSIITYIYLHIKFTKFDKANPPI